MSKKKLITILLLLISGIATPQDYKANMDRVWTTLRGLPIAGDWRLQDAKDYYYKHWKSGIYGVKIEHTDKDEYMGDSPGRYITPDSIHINPAKFTAADNQRVVVEHELYHAAFDSDVYIPGWMLWLGNKTDIGEPYNGVERVVMALIMRRDVLDYHKLPLNSILTGKQIAIYVFSKLVFDTGTTILLNTTKPAILVKLLNFENGYEL